MDSTIPYRFFRVVPLLSVGDAKKLQVLASKLKVFVRDACKEPADEVKYIEASFLLPMLKLTSPALVQVFESAGGGKCLVTHALIASGDEPVRPDDYASVNRIEGICLFWRGMDPIDGNETIHIQRILVAPGSRRTGLGGQMVEELKAQLRHVARSRITTWVRPNEAAISLFFGRGFSFNMSRASMCNIAAAMRSDTIVIELDRRLSREMHALAAKKDFAGLISSPRFQAMRSYCGELFMEFQTKSM